MNTHADKTQKNKSQSVANELSQKQGGGESTFQFIDNRPESIAKRKLQEVVNNSAQVKQLQAFQEMANNSPQVKQAAQLQAIADNFVGQQKQPIQKIENNTGLPDNLKSGIENLSGYSMDDVKVHYNSDKPEQLQAHAYAQGTDIHLASGQEKHLPHEAWHVAQQKQGRVKPTMQMKGAVNINDDAGLEKEADVMGAKAVTQKSPDFSTLMLAKLTTNEEDSKSLPVVKSQPLVREAAGDQQAVQRIVAGNVIIQRLTKTSLADELGNGRITETKNQVGLAAWNYLLEQAETFWPAISFFANQPHPIVNARDQGEFLKLHLPQQELASAQVAIEFLNYNPDGAAVAMYNYVHKYRIMGLRIYNVARAELATAVNDPVAAEVAMVALAPYDYYTTVKQNVDVMAGGKARAEIDQEKLDAGQEKADFEARYQIGTGYAIDHAFNANEAKALIVSKRDQLEQLLPYADLDSGNWGAKRNSMNEERMAKITAMGGRAAVIEGRMPARTALHTGAAQNILTPVYAVNAPEPAANWCLAQAGQNLQLLTSCAEIMVAVNGSIALLTELNPLNLPAKRVLLGKLSNTQQGQLSASGINDFIDSLAPLNGTAINALVNLLHPALSSRDIDTLVLDLAPANGTAIDAFVQQYVPAISGAQLAGMVQCLRPLAIANIDIYINRLLTGLNLGQIYALTVALTPGAGAIGDDLLQITATLMSIGSPLTAVQINTLVLAMDGVAGDQINTMVNQLIAMGVNTGTSIYGRIRNMRGSLQVGGADSTDVTTLDGERILSGTQIAGRIGQVAGPAANYAHLSLYPHSNINPVGRAENLLWGDCDSTVHRHPNETAEDITMRQQMALNAIINLGGVDRQIAQRVFAEQEGRHPRVLGTGAQEDAISGGHINSRHVLGTGGKVSTLNNLQLRANGDVNYPPCPGIAGAFASAVASQVGMQNALNAHIAANANNWNILRSQLIRGQTRNLLDVAAAVAGHVARNRLPMNNAPAHVHIQFTGENVNGGFWVFESWPQP